MGDRRDKKNISARIGDTAIGGNPEDILNLALFTIYDIMEVSPDSNVVAIEMRPFLENDPMYHNTLKSRSFTNAN